eukprot:s480_g16.t2
MSRRTSSDSGARSKISMFGSQDQTLRIVSKDDVNKKYPGHGPKIEHFAGVECEHMLRKELEWSDRSFYKGMSRRELQQEARVETRAALMKAERPFLILAASGSEGFEQAGRSEKVAERSGISKYCELSKQPQISCVNQRVPSHDLQPRELAGGRLHRLPHLGAEWPIELRHFRIDFVGTVFVGLCGLESQVN